MSKVTVGIYLPCGVNVSPQPFFADGYESIQHAVNGMFDAVTTNCGSDQMLFVGFVNDNGIADQLEYNYLATNMFRKELYGDCVMFWGLNAEGIRDGDIYDIPDSLFATLQATLEESTSFAYNASLGMAELCRYAEENKLVEKSMLDACIMLMVNNSLGKDVEKCQMQVALGFLANMCIEVADTIGDDIDDDESIAMRDFAIAMAEQFIGHMNRIGEDNDGE